MTAELLYFLLLLLSRRVLPVRKVTVANQTMPVLVMEGRTVLMSCRTDEPWFFCLWDTPGPGHQVIFPPPQFYKSQILRDVQDLECAIQYDQPERICSENNQTKLIGEREACSVEFVVDIYNCNQKNFKSISNN